MNPVTFYEYMRRVWLGPLPMSLARAILIALLFELLALLVRSWIQRRLRPILLRDAGDPPAVRVQRRRLLLAVPFLLSRAVLYVVAGFLILRVLGLRTEAELLPLGLALVVVCLVAFRRPLRDAAQGYLLLYDHLYTRGERVILAGQEGTVQEIRLRATELTAADGSKVVVPHSQVGQVVNLARRSKTASAAAEGESPAPPSA